MTEKEALLTDPRYRCVCATTPDGDLPCGPCQDFHREAYAIALQEGRDPYRDEPAPARFDRQAMLYGDVVPATETSEQAAARHRAEAVCNVTRD